MPVLNQICSYLSDTLTVVVVKLADVVVAVGQAGVAIVKKIILLD